MDHQHRAPSHEHRPTYIVRLLSRSRQSPKTQHFNSNASHAQVLLESVLFGRVVSAEVLGAGQRLPGLERLLGHIVQGTVACSRTCHPPAVGTVGKGCLFEVHRRVVWLADWLLHRYLDLHRRNLRRSNLLNLWRLLLLLDVVAAVELCLGLARETAEAAEVLNVDGPGHHLAAASADHRGLSRGWQVEARGQCLLDRARTVERGRLLSATAGGSDDVVLSLLGHGAAAAAEKAVDVRT